MRRRSPKSGTPLNAKQEELARRESQLRAEMQKLQQMISEAPRKAEERSRREREEIIARAKGESRLDVSMALQDKRFGDSSGYSSGRRGALRKEQREGRIVFLVLVLALAAAVIWLMAHLRF